MTTVAPITYYDRVRTVAAPTCRRRPADAAAAGRAGRGTGLHAVGGQARRRRSLRNGSTLAVARADYTTFHELLSAGVPTVFVPDPRPATISWPGPGSRPRPAWRCAPTAADRAGRRAGRGRAPGGARGAGRRCAEVAFVNGAGDAADWIAGAVPRPDRSG